MGRNFSYKNRTRIKIDTLECLEFDAFKRQNIWNLWAICTNLDNLES